MSDPTDETAATERPRYVRRQWDHILIACHQACDQNDLEIAELLLTVLEMIVSRARLSPGAEERRVKEGLVAAHERLWQLRHPDAGE